MNELKKLTLLYVEDEIETLNYYMKYFQSYFEKVYSAEDGEKALELYEEFRPNVLILDINLPFISGLEIAKKIREKDIGTKIIILSAMSDKETLIQSIELGLTTFLEKPVSRKQLQDAFGKLSINTTRIISKQNDKNYIWDTYKNELTYDNKNIKLTKNEIKLLKIFIENINKKLSYQEIYEYVWYEEDHKQYSEAAIKTLIKGLRLKLPPNTIKNVYGIGYFMDLIS